MLGIWLLFTARILQQAYSIAWLNIALLLRICSSALSYISAVEIGTDDGVLVLAKVNTVVFRSGHPVCSPQQPR